MTEFTTIQWLWVVLPMLFLTMGCSGRSPSREPRLPDGAAEWRAEGEVQPYDTETIFGYIDGHAEVYLAYGMKNCLSRRYAGPDGQPDIVVDLFEMASPDDAFGVFTVDLDGETTPMGHDGRFRYGWLSFWKGPYFVSITAEDETEEARAATFELGHTIAAMIDADATRPAILARLPREGLDRRSIRFLRSRQILNTHLYLGEGEIFHLGPDTGAALAKYSRENRTAHLMMVEYGDGDQAEKALRSFADRFLEGRIGGAPHQDGAGRWWSSRRDGNHLVAVLGAGSEEVATGLTEEAAQGRSNE